MASIIFLTVTKNGLIFHFKCHYCDAQNAEQSAFLGLRTQSVVAVRRPFIDKDGKNVKPNVWNCNFSHVKPCNRGKLAGNRWHPRSDPPITISFSELRKIAMLDSLTSSD